MTTLRVGGVPEHFNYPWRLAQERGLFAKHGVEVEWTVQRCGTGQMIKNLREDRVDVIVALTEGLVASIAQGSDLRLLGCYVTTPLCWAISVGRDSPYKSVGDLEGETWGISRYSSGSHLMAFVLAMQRGWDVSAVHFNVEGNFEQLRNAVNSGSSASFMWETFTTKPFHDSGEVRRIGDITTPWPCFMMCARRSVIEEKHDAMRGALKAIREACRIFHRECDTMPLTIAKEYQLREEDARKWYSQVQVEATRSISVASLKRTLDVLSETGVLTKEQAALDVSQLVEPRFVTLVHDITSMKLYDLFTPELVTSLYQKLRAAGLSKGELTWQQLSNLTDINHYHGKSAMDACAELCHFENEDFLRVLNFGSNLGGPARYICGKYNAQVLAVELQHELHAAAQELTRRCSMDRCVHMCGDFVQLAPFMGKESYDAIVSWLTVLHIPTRGELFAKSLDLLKPGGVFYAEDFFDRGSLTAEEKQELSDGVFCKYLPTLEQYKVQLEDAGFEVELALDLTDDWTSFTKQRAASFRNDRRRHVEVHGERIVDSLQHFFNLIAHLFEGGNLGGVRLLARKPLHAVASTAE